MLVIVSVRRLDNDRIEIGVARPPHDSNPSHNYPSEKEVPAVLSHFGISDELIASHLKLLARMGTREQLKFPPMDVLQNELRSRGLGLSELYAASSAANALLIQRPRVVVLGVYEGYNPPGESHGNRRYGERI